MASPDDANPYAPPQAEVRDFSDPSAVELADRGVRLGASILDTLAVVLLVYVPLFIGAIAGGVAAGVAQGGVPFDEAAQDAVISRLATGLGGLFGLVGFSIWCALTLRFMWLNGQSIGKKLLGIRVVRSDGSRASLARLVWRRNAINWFFSLLPAYGVVDSLFIFSQTRQCLHDKIADTIVVKT